MPEDNVRRAFSKVKIIMDGHGQGRLWLDGVEIRAVVGWDIATRVGDTNRMTVQLLVEEVEIDAPVEVTLVDTNYPPENMFPRTLDHRELEFSGEE